MIQGVIEILTRATATEITIGKNSRNDAVKVYPVRAPQGEQPPYTVLAITNNRPDQCKDSPSRTDNVTFVAVTYAESYEAADTIDESIRFSIEGFKGDACGIDFQNIWLDDQGDSWEQSGDSGYIARTSTYRCIVKKKAPLIETVVAALTGFSAGFSSGYQ